MKEYINVPSYKLVLIYKDCKTLLKARPEYRVPLMNTMTMIRNLLIERQVI